MRTIIVIFTERRLSLNEVASYKRYKLKYNTLADLAIIAKFFNGSWKKTTNNTGYFLGNFNAGCGPVVDTCNGVGVYQHNTVQYAGVVYFKNQEDAIKAVKILGKRVKSLFD